MNQQPSSPPSAALAGADAPVLCVSSQTWRRGSLRRLFWQALVLIAGAGLAWAGRPEWRHWPPPGAQ